VYQIDHDSRGLLYVMKDRTRSAGIVRNES
jgi:hypothetical protein